MLLLVVNRLNYFFYMMFTFNKFLIVLVCFSNLKESWQRDIPNYIQICKRDQSTINDCVRNSIEKLRPKLAEGIPDLNVPAIEPFYMAELLVDSGDLAGFHAVGTDLKVSGAGNFSIKSFSMDLDTLTIRSRVRFPHLHFEGQYKVDSKLPLLNIQGQGPIFADAVRCDAEVVVRSQLVVHDGVQYIKFTNVDMDITVKDYHIRLEGLFNGDKRLGDVTNEALNQNRGEFLKAAKPYIERTTTKLFLDIANKISGTFPFDDLLPKN